MTLAFSVASFEGKLRQGQGWARAFIVQQASAGMTALPFKSLYKVGNPKAFVYIKSSVYIQFLSEYAGNTQG